ncbi:MAG: RsmE family RNA methyltransferase, partial [Burkholderiales bacterium]|nr:RsmE family RNA methyltransferase [Burkholderiales bacterium]
VRALAGWLAALPPLPTATAGDARWLLSLQPGAMTPGRLFGPHGKLGTLGPAGPLTLLSGPEGGFAPDEDAAARRAGFEPVALGPRVLRADTAPLAVLGWLALQAAN